MAHYTADIRLYIPQELMTGQTITLPEKQHHYLKHVVRLQQGAEISLFNGKDGEFTATLTDIRKKECDALIGKQTKPFQAPTPLTLYFAPFKRGMDAMIAKATDFGVTHFQPIITQHAVVKGFKAKRYEAIMIEAAEQVGRLEIPTISHALAIQKLQPTMPTLFANEDITQERLALIQALQTQPNEIGFICGAEGGFNDKERNMLRAQENITSVSLGKHIYKADSAILAMLATLAMVRA